MMKPDRKDVVALVGGLILAATAMRSLIEATLLRAVRSR